MVYNPLLFLKTLFRRGRSIFTFTAKKRPPHGVHWYVPDLLVYSYTIHSRTVPPVPHAPVTSADAPARSRELCTAPLPELTRGSLSHPPSTHGSLCAPSLPELTRGSLSGVREPRGRGGRRGPVVRALAAQEPGPLLQAGQAPGGFRHAARLVRQRVDRARPGPHGAPAGRGRARAGASPSLMHHAPSTKHHASCAMRHASCTSTLARRHCIHGPQLHATSGWRLRGCSSGCCSVPRLAGVKPCIKSEGWCQTPSPFRLHTDCLPKGALDEKVKGEDALCVEHTEPL
jgi:hypothetical protein